MMVHVPGVLSKEQVVDIRRDIDAASWENGRATVGEQGARVKHNQQLPRNSEAGKRAGVAILAALSRHPLFFSAALPRDIVPPLFNRYEGGETYGLHIDGAAQLHAKGWIRTDLSCTLFLSEPARYEGGELEVVDTYGTHEVKLPAGDLILYPSSSLHQVLPVTAGARVCSFFWVQSMVRDEARRRELYELDQTINSVKAQLGECPQTLSLTNHYHNLLRMWADI